MLEPTYPAFGLIVVRGQRRRTSRKTDSWILKKPSFDTNPCGPFEDYIIVYVNNVTSITARNTSRVRAALDVRANVVRYENSPVKSIWRRRKKGVKLKLRRRFTSFFAIDFISYSNPMWVLSIGLKNIILFSTKSTTARLQQTTCFIFYLFFDRPFWK